jgi:Kef-type K+ transport system membrane component KefB
MSELSNHPVFIVMAVAVAATLLAEVPVGFRLPVVVLEMLFGIAIGPHGLAITDAGGLLGWLGAPLAWRPCSSWEELSSISTA